MKHQDFMQLAILEAYKGIKKNQAPFGACIVKEGKVIAVGHNHVWKNTDITSHGEVFTIRKACKKLKTIDLSGCIIYSTCEPCPMCFSACHWAQLDAIYYGASIEDAKKAGFSELNLSNKQMKKLGGSPIKVVGGVLKKEAQLLFDVFLKNGKTKLY